MKIKAFCLLALVGSLAPGFGFEIPRGFKTVSELEAAKSEAYDGNEPVVYLISQKALEPT